jgi:hypothetical protein
MGYGLQRLTRARRDKLPVVIPEGMTRPVIPIVAAKFATKCNIAIRNHIPVLKHWSEYKNQPALFDLFVARIRVSTQCYFNLTCMEMMKTAVLQQRYRLKHTYSDPFPLHMVTETSPLKCISNEQWNNLVDSWKNSKNMVCFFVNIKLLICT